MTKPNNESPRPKKDQTGGKLGVILFTVVLSSFYLALLISTPEPLKNGGNRFAPAGYGRTPRSLGLSYE